MTNNLKAICKSKGISLIKISNDLNISYRSIQRYVSGEREPDYKTLKDIANYLNVTIDDLLNETSSKTIPLTKEDFKRIIDLQNEINEIYAKYR